MYARPRRLRGNDELSLDDYLQLPLKFETDPSFCLIKVSRLSLLRFSFPSQPPPTP
jgi:hypothetical protein